MIAEIKKIRHWTILFLVTDLVFIFVAWILNPQYLKNTMLFILLFTLFALGTGCFFDYKKKRKLQQSIGAYLENPDEERMERLLLLLDDDWHSLAKELCGQMKKQADMINHGQLELKNYQEFIEAWTHEIKTPLSLEKMVLNHRKDEMTSYVFSRMNYASHQISENVERILYYARLEADHVDYKLIKLRLDECVREMIAEYEPIAREKEIHFQLHLLPEEVVSDKRLVYFMLSQLIGNAVKYAPSGNGMITIAIWKKEHSSKIHLEVSDNGNGVPPQDAPFVFDKGFTGSHPNRQSATGMGLYLVKKYAEELAIDVRLSEGGEMNTGFHIELVFPYVSE